MISIAFIAAYVAVSLLVILWFIYPEGTMTQDEAIDNILTAAWHALTALTFDVNETSKRRAASMLKEALEAYINLRRPDL